MKKGTKRDVSIGFFYTADKTPGTIVDGPFQGEAYDYVQRSMFHDHLAVGLDAKNGRCPSPYCGLGADEITQKIGNDPFSGFKKFSDCQEKIRKENPGMSESEVSGICGKLEAEWKAKHKGDEEVRKEIHVIAQELLDAMEEIKGLKESNADSTKKFPEWWRSVDWKEGTYATIYDHLSPDIQKFIADARLCPKCEEAKRADAKMQCEEKMKVEHPDWTPEQMKVECEKIMAKASKKADEVVLPMEDKKPELTPEEKAKVEEELKKLEEEKKKKESPKADEKKLDPQQVLREVREMLKK
jgi:hypothetical protein